MPLPLRVPSLRRQKQPIPPDVVVPPQRRAIVAVQACLLVLLLVVVIGAWRGGGSSDEPALVASQGPTVAPASTAVTPATAPPTTQAAPVTSAPAAAPTTGSSQVAPGTYDLAAAAGAPAAAGETAQVAYGDIVTELAWDEAGLVAATITVGGDGEVLGSVVIDPASDQAFVRRPDVDGQERWGVMTVAEMERAFDLGIADITAARTRKVDLAALPGVPTADGLVDVDGQQVMAYRLALDRGAIDALDSETLGVDDVASEDIDGAVDAVEFRYLVTEDNRLVEERIQVTLGAVTVTTTVTWRLGAVTPIALPDPATVEPITPEELAGTDATQTA